MARVDDRQLMTAADCLCVAALFIAGATHTSRIYYDVTPLRRRFVERCRISKRARPATQRCMESLYRLYVHDS